MGKKSKALARALAKDNANMERVRGMYPASGGGAPSMPNQEAALNQANPELDKALGNPVRPLDAHPAIHGHGGFDQQGQAHNGSWAQGRLTGVPMNTYAPGAPVVGHGVSETIGDVVMSYMDPRSAAGRISGLTSRPSNGTPRNGVIPGSGGGSNGSHVATQSAVSNAVASKSSVQACKEALNELSRRTNG